MRHCTLARGCMCAAPVTRELLNEGIWLIMRYCNLARGQVSSTGQKVFEEAPGCSLKIALWWEAICSSCQKSFARDQNWWTWKIALVAFAKQGFLGRGPGEPETLHSSIKPYPCSTYRNALLKDPTRLSMKTFILVRGLLCEAAVRKALLKNPPCYTWNAAFLHEGLCV